MALSGVGLGFRSEYFDELLQLADEGDERRPQWLEILIDNFADGERRQWLALDELRQRYNLAFHCTGLDIGGAMPLDRERLLRIADMMRRLQATQVSAHLCWTAAAGRFSHELLPLPATEESLKRVSGRVAQAQEWLGAPLILENVSACLRPVGEMGEGQFLAACARRSGARLLLDINNLFVNFHNFGEDPRQILDCLDAASVAMYHIAGYQDLDGLLVDSHGAPVDGAVWKLWQAALERIGPRPLCLERDQNLPPLEELLGELQQARALMVEHAA
ncbi:MAG: DUF692 domain-containing protein [Leptospirales bacterium]|nr:DUF692 domain-containing protein [Leptospirales bacterium]